ncbi:MAG TPA: hypothetical protein VMD30_03825 [Tepidisphaeraceae bacterium]|nr:hypothetical protein [Tepidisphaeraceae bacterium]
MMHRPIERLESRRLLSASVTVKDVLQVYGTAGADNIAISESGGGIVVTVNGAEANGSPFIGVNSVRIHGMAGADTITIDSSVPLTQKVVIDGGMGDDSLVADGGHGVIFGGAGNDNISVNAASYDINGGIGADTIAATGGANEIIHGEAGADSINVSGGGYDLIFGGPGGNTIDVAGGFDTVISGSGHDDVTADDGATALLFDMSGGDTVTGNVGADTGGDTVYTSGHTDSLNLNSSIDVVNPSGVTHPPHVKLLLTYLRSLTDPSQLPPTI